MPISKRWSHFTKENVTQEDNVFGVYELGDTNGEVVYIGEGRLRDRLLSHFPSGSDPIPGTKYYRVEKTGSKLRAEQRERALLNDYAKKHNGRLPKYNQRRR